VIALAAALLLQAGAPQGPMPEVVTRSRLDPARGVDFHAVVTPETVYVGQQATYQLGVFLTPETRQRLRRNPEFVPPESRSMLSYDLAERNGGFTGSISGRPYEVHVFRRALFPLTPGRYVIPQARLTYALPQSQSFFSREENFSLRSESVTLVVVEPPAENRPAEWTGAVGVLRASARLTNAGGRAGDPIVLTVVVEGQGNVTLLPRPSVSIPWATVVPADERVRVDSNLSAMRGSKEFDWLVTPRKGGDQVIPSIRYDYFNPLSRRYEASSTPLVAVRIAAGGVVALDSANVATAAPVLALRPFDASSAFTPLGDLWVVRVLLLLAPLPALIGWIVRRPKRRRPARTAAERLEDLATVGADPEPAETRRVLQSAIRHRTGLAPADLTQPGAWARALALEGVSVETARDVDALMQMMDAASFGAPGAAAHAVGGAELATRAQALYRRVNTEARRPNVPGSAAAIARPASLALLLLAASPLFARDVLVTDPARMFFHQGVTAYAGADYLRAARFFNDAARLAPRLANSWANFGTASWAVRDTASAVVGWQRARRLDPMATALRDRLALVHAPQDTGYARVTALPRLLPATIAFLLWLVGWGVCARQSWRRRPSLVAAITTLAVAGSLGVAARLFEESVEGRRLAVVAEPTALKTLPALGAESSSVPITGEVARVALRQGAWAHIILDSAREGWIPAERIVALGRD